MAISDFTSKVRGCWLGKNIGGTLGAPFEGQQEFQDVSFYTQENLNGNPEPNDDLDLQLIWLTLAEYYGIYKENLLEKLPELIWELPKGKISQFRYRFHNMITDRFATVTEDKKLDGRETKRIIGKKETV